MTLNWRTWLWHRKDAESEGSWLMWLEVTRSCSGHEREAAVKALVSSGEGGALPCLLERCNDWVPQVRDAARQGVIALMREVHLPFWTQALPQVAALQRGGRADHAGLLSAIQNFLTRGKSLEVLLATADRSSKDVRRLLFALQLQAAHGDERALAQTLSDGVLSSDKTIATRSLATIESLPTADGRHALATVACRSIFAPVRLRGWRLVLASPVAPTQQFILSMCRDVHPHLRSLALMALGDDRGLALAQAQQALACSPSARARAIALDVLCELNPAEASGLCTDYAADPAAAVRALALSRLLSASSGEERDAMVADALGDRAAQVRALAVRHVGRGASPPAVEVLEAIVEKNPEALGNAISMAAHLSPWSRVIFLLRSLFAAGGKSDRRDRLQQELDGWSSDMIRCFVGPTDGQGRQVAQAWGAVESALRTDTRRRAARHLKAFNLL